MSRFSSWYVSVLFVLLSASVSYATLPVPAPSLGKSFAGASASFGEVEIGGTSVGSVQVCTVCSAAECVPPYLVVNATNVAGDAFEIEGANCVGSTIPVGACCKVKVRMSPKTEGSQQGSVTFVTSGGNLTWSLSGIGISGELPPDDSENSCLVPSHSFVSIDSLSLEEKIPLVGVPFDLSYSSRKFRPKFRLNVKKYGLGGWTPSLVHEYDPLRETLYFGDGSSRNVIAKEKDNELFAANSSGSEVYYFNSIGRHLYTRNGLTGLIIYRNSYDNAGRVSSIVDSYGNTTTFNYEGSLVTITSPYGQSTQILVDENGWLKSVTNPNGETFQVETAQNGFLTSFQKPGGQKSIVSYDSDGFVTSDRGAGGDITQFLRTFEIGSSNQTVVSSTALKRESKYTTAADGGSFKRTTVSSWGGTSVFENGDGGDSSVNQYGLQFSSSQSNDPRFGDMAKYESQSNLSYPNQSIKISVGRAVTAELTDAQDPFSFSLLRTVTTLQNANDNVIVEEYDPQLRRSKTVTAEKQVFSKFLNDHGQTSRLQIGTLAPLDISYDDRGRLNMVAQGPRQTLFGYDTRGNLSSYTDGLGRSSQFEYDNSNRMIRRSSPSGSSVSLSYDPNGNLLGVVPAGRRMHKFEYNLFELVSEYMPPQVGAWLYGSTHYEYNLDQKLISIAKPGRQKIQLTYNNLTGLPISIEGEGEKYSFDYYPNSNLVKSIFAPSGQKTTKKYNGDLVSSVEESGEVNGAISYGFNQIGLVSNVSISGKKGDQDTASLAYDKDNRLISYGSLNFQYNENGLMKVMTLNSLTQQMSYDAYGEKNSEIIRSGSKEVARFTYLRDANGRITSEQQFLGKDSRKKDYVYDLDGRLTKATVDGRVIREYQYDANGNRTLARTGGKKFVASYNDLDMLMSYGANTYKYSANGELIEKIEKSGILSSKTKFGHDVFGNLRWVMLPCGDRIDYIVDGQNRRIGKKINGKLVQGFIYQSQTQVAAEIDGSGRVVKRFFYGSKTNIPDSMAYKGKEYRIVSNQVGTPILLVDAHNGRVVEEYQMDEFGLSQGKDSKSLLPFGFAGGLYDQDTGLLKFGARDYDPEIGRWTSKDPILFAGGDTNLFGYVANDPINWTDPTGLARGDWWDPRTYVLPIVEGGQGATDFVRNYGDMRDANTIGADKYFHCMANCQASQRGPGGQSAAVGISEGRELFDQYIKGDSPNACNADRAANAQGRSGAGGGACDQVCGSLRPGGLGSQR